VTSDPHPVQEAAGDASGLRLGLVCGLLLFLIALAIVVPNTPAAQSLATAVSAVALAISIWAARVPRRFANALLAVIGIAAVGAILGVELGDSPVTADSVVTLLLVAVPISIVVGLRGERTVNVQTVFGAISVYLVIGLMFANLITIVGRETTSPYFAQGTDGTVSERTYFSFVTLATLGYGDLTPATSVGRLAAVFESILGSLYLVTAVSLVVSRVGAPRPDRGSRSPQRQD
jgi:ion channel